MIYTFSSSTVDWEELNVDNFLEQDVSWLAPPFCYRFPAYLNYIKEWNKQFKIDYFSFKQKLKNIATKNKIKIKGKTLAKKQLEETMESATQNDLFLVCDDDDIFSHEISEIQSDDCHAILWTHTRLQIDKILKDPPYFKNFGTCNYLITKKGWESTKNYNKQLFYAHIYLTNQFLNPKMRTRYINQSLSLTLKTPASLCNINSALEANKSPKKYLLESIKTTKISKEDLDWAEDELNELENLYQSL